MCVKRGNGMLFKKNFEESEARAIQMGKGHVHFKGVHLSVYCFAVDGVLIDTGAQSLLKQFKPFFEKVDVDKVVITHQHEDHTGGAAYLQQHYQLPIYMNELSIEECQQRANYPLYRKLFWGKRAPFQASALGDTFESRNATWDVIATPGHAKDHVSFFNRETKHMFTGDLYIMPKTKVVLREESIPTIIESLKRVLTYDFEEVFCHHAGYIQNGRAAIEKKLNYLQHLCEQVHLLREEGLAVDEMNAKLFGRNYPIVQFSGGEWDSKHIITSILNQ